MSQFNKVAWLKASHLMRDKDLVFVEAGDLRSLGHAVPDDVPDTRPVKMTVGAMRALCNEPEPVKAIEHSTSVSQETLVNEPTEVAEYDLDD